MIKMMQIQNEYIYLPISIEKEEKLLEIFCFDTQNQEKKIMEFMIPAGEVADGVYSFDYFARFPVKEFIGKTLILKGEVPEAFMKEVCNTSFIAYEPLRRPLIHFTTQRGWINDPNGLVIKDGYYHLYYQYNPCNIKWNNMSWGHAVSRDLLHWEEKDITLMPDEDGMMFSGSALVNERGMLGLPKDAILFFYSAAGSSNNWGKGKQFVQKVAYSLDNGDTLIKTETGKLSTICKENRDPKVFWHGESRAYIMCLWLEENDFAILRSTDLIEWKMTDKLKLKGAWECPDLVKIPTEDGNYQWMFWTADGFYYWGEFDGYTFKTDAIKHQAYFNKLPYAAQTYAGIKNRVVMISWIRSMQEGRLYRGSMGLPRELSIISYQGEKYLSQKPIRELKENSKLIFNKSDKNMINKEFRFQSEEVTAITMDMQIKTTSKTITEWYISGIKVSYHADSGLFTMGEESYEIGKNIYVFSFLIDDVIFEVIANNGIMLGVFELPEDVLNISVNTEQFEKFNVYQINETLG